MPMTLCQLWCRGELKALRLLAGTVAKHGGQWDVPNAEPHEWLPQ